MYIICVRFFFVVYYQKGRCWYNKRNIISKIGLTFMCLLYTVRQSRTAHATGGHQRPVVEPTVTFLPLLLSTIIEFSVFH